MSATLRLKCFECGAIMTAYERQAGRRSHCPVCEVALMIPPRKYFELYDGRKVRALAVPTTEAERLDRRTERAIENDRKRADQISPVVEHDEREEFFEVGAPDGPAPGAVERSPSEEARQGESESDAPDPFR